MNDQEGPAPEPAPEPWYDCEPEPEPEPELWPEYPPARPTRLAPANPDPLATYDALWRKQPRVPGFMDFCRVIGGYLAQFQTAVPDEAVTRLADREVEITCSCGQTPRCRWNGVTACACGRVFAYCAGDVRVAYIGGAPVVD